MASKNKNLVDKGQCINFGLCDKADTKEIIEIPVGEDFVCPNPDCQGRLNKIEEKPPMGWLKYVIIAVVVIGGGIGGYFALKGGDKQEKVLVSSITLNQSNFNLEVNKSATLAVSIQPDSATNKSVEWSSSDTSIATVDETGIVMAIKEGAATIEVKTIDGSNLSATSTVNVQNKQEPPTDKPKTTTKEGNNEGDGGSGDLPCGKYEGKTSNGKPHGMGTFTYKTRTLIDDHKMVYAEKGDYITGTFREGKIVSVHLYDSGGNLKQTVIPQQPASICR